LSYFKEEEKKMKVLQVVLVLACTLALMGCPSQQPQQQPPIQVTVNTPAQPQPQVKEPEIQPRDTRYYEGEKIPDQIAPNTAAEYRHEEKIDRSQAATEIIPEKKTVDANTGEVKEQLYMRVLIKDFDDKDMLEQLRYTIFQCAQNNNYKITEEEPGKSLNRKSCALKLASELPGPISLTETLTNALEEYKGRFTLRRVDEHLLVITPR